MAVVEPPKTPPRRGGAKSRVRVHELLATRAAVDKLGARSISPEEAEQLLRNKHVTARNRQDARSGADRRLLIGRTDGGRTLTVVIEATIDPSTWLIVTAWPATLRERIILRDSSYD
jgi:uncharacterized DUF497 family protein